MQVSSDEAITSQAAVQICVSGTRTQPELARYLLPYKVITKAAHEPREVVFFASTALYLLSSWPSAAVSGTR